MTTLSIECFQVLSLWATFLGKCRVLSAGGSKPCFCLDGLNISLLLGHSHLICGSCTGTIDNLDNVGLDLTLCSKFLTFYLSDKHIADLFSLDDSDFLLRCSRHSVLVLLNLRSVDLRFNVLHLSVVGSLHIGKFLILLILQCQFLISIFFDVVGETVLALCLFF